MRFSYAAASLALFAATAQAYSTGSPVCKSDDATLGKIAKAGKMGKQADAKTFSGTWAFQLWDENGKEVTGDSVMTNMDYWVTVTGGEYKGVMVYPMFDGQRIPTAKEDSIVSLSPGDDFQIAAKCAGTDGVTVTHTSPDSKDDKAKVAKVKVMDENAGKFMMSGVVVTGKNTFGKAVTPTYQLEAGKDDGNNTGDNGDNGDDTGNGDNGDNGDNGGNTPNGDNGTGTDDGTNTASSMSFVQPTIALIALAAFMLI